MTTSAWNRCFLVGMLGVCGAFLGACRSPSTQQVPSQVVAPPPAPPVPPPPPPKPPFVRSSIPRLDFHVHVSLGAATRAVRMLERYGITYAVNLSGPPSDAGLDEYLADAEVAYGRLAVFTNLPWMEARQPGYAKKMVAALVKAKAAGARGVKIPKGLGLGFTGPNGQLLKVDDPGLDPVFEKAGELGLPVAIHIGDPQAFWLPSDEKNERQEELQAHPEWSFYGDYKSGLVPAWRELFDAFLRRVQRHPKTTFIGVHFGNAPEEPSLVAAALDRYPNLVIDTAARIPAIGRTDANHSAERMRAFFIKYQDRILLGTDTGVGRDPNSLMFGSSGTAPTTQADGDVFFDSTWRYFETADREIPSPTPIQGRWTISGINLPPSVLEKIYYKNGEKLLGLTIQAGRVPVQESGSPPRLEDL
jgi:predicted TIM-barrel fold metal-dependent hydrolase